MKALRIHGYGDAGSALFEDVPIPEPGLDELLIRVGAASVNPLDLKLIGGLRREVFPLSFPYTPGTDFMGTVERAGPLAVRWRAGDTVIARAAPTRGGAFAEYAVVPALNVAAAPKTLAPAHSAGLPTAAGTAWQALIEVAHLKAGQTLLVHAGAGGVGAFAIQIGKIAGARVVATASGDGLALARAFGADEVVDYRSADFTARPRDVDLVLDTIGGDTQTRSFGVLKPGGLLVSIVNPPDPAQAEAHGVKAVRLGHETLGARLELIAGACDDGRLRVPVDRSFPFADAAAALARSASGRARGKIVLEIA